MKGSFTSFSFFFIKLLFWCPLNYLKLLLMKRLRLKHSPLFDIILSFPYLSIIMHDGVWEKAAMKAVRPNRITKGRRRCSHPLPQLRGKAKLRPPTHRHSVYFYRNAHANRSVICTAFFLSKPVCILFPLLYKVILK